MVKGAQTARITDDTVRALLERYACPVPYHEVRTRMLGSIASPVTSVLPMRVMASFWGGHLPAFESVEAANELLGGLMMGLWNRLAKHQNRDAPFHLTRAKAKPTREGLAALALMRRQELDGFVEGLFAGQGSIDLPERAHRALGTLAELSVRFRIVAETEGAEGNPTVDREPHAILLDLQMTTRRAEREINAIVTSCTLARRQALDATRAAKPTLH